MIWLKKMIKEPKKQFTFLTKLYCDTKAAISIAHNSAEERSVCMAFNQQVSKLRTFSQKTCLNQNLKLL